MAGQAWLESSLRRSASLGLEVLERTSRRNVDWTNTGASPSSTNADIGTQIPGKGTHRELHDAFGTIAEFMAQTTHQCKMFYESSCTQPTDTERTHVSRFHTRPAGQRTAPVRTPRKRACASTASEDFYIEVSPGTYAVTASLPESQQQTRLVSVRAGESVDLIFNL